MKWKNVSSLLRRAVFALALGGVSACGDGKAPIVRDPSRLEAGEDFRDCRECPEMVIVPAGQAQIGSPDAEPGRLANEGPRRNVRIAQLAIGKYEVTMAQWQACVDEGGCAAQQPGEEVMYMPEPRERAVLPMTNITWTQAHAFVTWLSQKTGAQYRLLSEAEWEYAARAGAASAYAWGDAASHDRANYGADACCAGNTQGRDDWFETSPVGAFGANAFGLYDMHGNVAEWVEDCYANSPDRLPTDGSPYRQEGCLLRSLRGGAWVSDPALLRAASRTGAFPGFSGPWWGLRVARAL